MSVARFDRPSTRAALLGLFDMVAAENRTLSLWWRDDDAVAETPALDRLLALSQRHQAPVALATIPTRLERSLPERLAGLGGVDVLVHGFAHANHAPPGEKKAEFGPHRPLAARIAEAGQALAITRTAFGDQALAVFVPPWNRIAIDLTTALPGAGYAGLSAARSKGARHVEQGPQRVDIHIDPIAWHDGGSLADPALIIGNLDEALRADPAADVLIGLLTHHLVHDEAIWTFTEDLLDLAARHRAVRFCSAANVFCAKASSGLDLHGQERHSRDATEG